MTYRIRFSHKFWVPGKIDRPITVFCKKNSDKIENYKYGGIGREYPHYYFLIILHPFLCKMTCRIRFSIKFWPPGKINRTITLFCKKKFWQNGKLQIWWVAWWGNSRLMIFWLFCTLYYVKWPVEFDFPINFDLQAKLTNLSQFFLKEKFDEPRPMIFDYFTCFIM